MNNSESWEASQDSELFIIKSFFINIIGYKLKEDKITSKNIKIQ